MLILEIPLNVSLDAGYKQTKFSMTLLKKGLKFMFDLGLVLLLAEIDFVTEEQSWKRPTLRACGIGHIEMILTLPTKVVVFYIGISVIQVRVPSLEDSILESKVCLAILFALNK